MIGRGGQEPCECGSNWTTNPESSSNDTALHAAFLAIGAYTAAYLQQFNVPFPVYFLAAGLLTGVVGALVGFPALRLQGIYLVIATISFAFIVEEILARWESVTNGNEGMAA